MTKSEATETPSKDDTKLIEQQKNVESPKIKAESPQSNQFSQIQDLVQTLLNRGKGKGSPKKEKLEEKEKGSSEKEPEFANS